MCAGMFMAAICGVPYRERGWSNNPCGRSMKSPPSFGASERDPASSAMVLLRMQRLNYKALLKALDGARSLCEDIPDDDEEARSIKERLEEIRERVAGEVERSVERQERKR
jgi:hypothetical protein